MTQFTFSELKPRIEEAILKREHLINMNKSVHVIGNSPSLTQLMWNNEPIELVENLTPLSRSPAKRKCTMPIFNSDLSALGITYVELPAIGWDVADLKIEAIGQHTGQVYTWSLNALLPDLFIDNKV